MRALASPSSLKNALVAERRGVKRGREMEEERRDECMSSRREEEIREESRVEGRRN
jgi:hypothetical protein